MNTADLAPGIHAWLEGSDPVVVHVSLCPLCNARGYLTCSRRINSPFAGDLFTADCPDCDGEGRTVNDICKCNGCAAAIAALDARAA